MCRLHYFHHYSAASSRVLALNSHGIRFVTPGPDDLGELERVAAEARAEIGRKGLYSPGLLQTLEGHLREFRAKGDAAAARR